MRARRLGVVVAEAVGPALETPSGRRHAELDPEICTMTDIAAGAVLVASMVALAQPGTAAPEAWGAQ